MLEGALTNDPGDIIYISRGEGAAATQFRHAAHKVCRATFEGATTRMAEFLCPSPEAAGTLMQACGALAEERTRAR